MRAALISVGVYAAIWLSVAITDLVKELGGDPESLARYYQEMKLGATIAGVLYQTYDLVNVNTDNPTQYGASLLFLLILIPFIIPALLSLICLVLLTRSLREEVPNEGSAVRQKHVTTTVVWLTVVFVVCTSASTLFWLFYQYIVNLVLDSHSIDSVVCERIYAFFSLTLPLLNAAISPLIIFWRSQQLRSEIRTEVERSFQSIRTWSKSRSGRSVRS